MSWGAFALSMWETLVQLAPWLLIGAAVAGLLHAVLPRDFVSQQLRGGGGILKAVLVGVPLPLCSCGVIPAGLGLKRDGAGDGASLGFLISTPQTGIDSIFVSATFLGWPFAIFKVLAAGVTGIVGGVWAERGGATEVAADVAPVPSEVPSRRGLSTAVPHALELLRSIWRWILFGIVVSAAIDVLVPSELLVAWGGMGTLGASLVVLLISLPLYVCATASVPIAASLVAGGMPVGAALVFLMAGPATNVATIGAIYRAFGRRILAIYLGVIVIGSVGFGWLFDRFFGSWKSELMAHEHASELWEVIAAIGLVLLMLFFLFEELRSWQRRRQAPANGALEEVRMPVSGMTCNGCVQQLDRAVRGLPDVEAVEVRLEPGEISVFGPVDEARLRDTIRQAGFEPL